MTEPKLTKLELQIMDALWTQRQASIRDIQEAFPELHRPAYTTIQTTVTASKRRMPSAASKKSAISTSSKPPSPAARPSASWSTTCSRCSGATHNR